MLKVILISWLTLPIILLGGECNYKKLSFKSGEPYLRLEIKNDTNQWIGITGLKFGEVLKTYSKKAELDSLLVLYKDRAKLCDENEKKYSTILKTLEDNEIVYVNLIDDYKKFSDNIYKKMIDAEGKKYSWGLMCTALGFGGGVLLVLFISMAVK